MRARCKLLFVAIVAFILLAFINSSQASGTVLFFDDFESGLGNWSNTAAGDNNDWTLDSDGTPSLDTGPLTGADTSTYYVYLETSYGSAYTAGDTAILQGPEISAANIHLDFKYHMYGSNIGTLAVDVLSDGSWINDVWLISGQQQISNNAAYTPVELDLSAYAVSRIRFRATAAGGYMGDIAIDDIDMVSIPSGPEAPVFNSDPVVKPDAIQGQLYSDSIADDAFDMNGDPLEFSKISGPVWLNIAADGTLSGTPDISDLGLNTFEVEVSDGALADTAIHEIYVEEETAPVLLNSSDFELDSGGWNNVSSGDNKDWTRNSGHTVSSGTGPSGGADGSNYYMYVETSYGSAYTVGDEAILQSPPVRGANIHLIFQYHMFGSDIGTLAIDIIDGGAWINNVWSATGQQHISNSEAYATVDVDLSAYDVAQIRLRVTAAGGYRGDIAVDNLEIVGIPDSGAENIVFATAQGYTGNLGGLAGADAICQAEAAAAGLTGTFKAFLSDNNISAADRLSHSPLPYELVNGTLIAADWDDLVDGRIENPLNVTASGTIISDYAYAWTGSDNDGTKATYNPNDYPHGFLLDLTCDNWTLETSSFHYIGARGKPDNLSAWLDYWQRDGEPCAAGFRLYCIEQ